MSIFHFLTPDQHLLAFEKVPKAQAVARIGQGEFFPATGDFPWQVRETVYLSPAGHCLYLYGSRDYGHLFATQTDFEQSITGRTYSNSTLLYDRQEQLRCAIELNFNAALPLVSQYLAIDTKYPSEEGYLVYRYADGSVCYLAHLSHPVQRQGWWFANLTDFEYFFHRVFNS